MLSRRLSILVLAGAALPSALAQRTPRRHRLATLSDGTPADGQLFWTVFRQRLKELGYLENTHYDLVQHWSSGNPAQLARFTADITANGADVIIADGTPSAFAARQASENNIPIVACRLSDPVRSGLVADFAQPGGNLTGTTIATADIAGKWLQLLRDLAPRTRSIIFMTDTHNQGGQQTYARMRTEAESLGLTILAMDARTPEEVSRAFKFAEGQQFLGLVVGTTPVVFRQHQQIIASAAALKIPTIYARREYAERGGLISYGTYLPIHYSIAAEYVDRILRGARAGEIPISRPTRFEMFLNAKTAAALGLKVPHALLLQADGIIE